MNKLLLLSFTFIILLSSCAKTVQNEVQVYSNDFESANLSGITGGIISSFNGSKVLGNYNKGEFNLTINDLPKHDLVDISFDLYIHDSWEGVQQIGSVSGPDIWAMNVDRKSYIYTTFANFDCVAGNFCPPQSYPGDYPAQSNNPKTGASRTDLPGFCSEASNPNGTTLYKIHKSVSHSDKMLLIQCLDKLVQTNVTDQKCDESWSVDNLVVKVIKYN
ncbi:hypothetical protein [Pedobacter sp. L105]|uniref:hypothetical protein n=1 Tax=Pedobacter sp. L105 TaxID=1641871 RepID=UPI00131CFCFC|nr:hypothetical protein [Pedobacter sp. L105]